MIQFILKLLGIEYKLIAIEEARIELGKDWRE